MDLIVVIAVIQRERLIKRNNIASRQIKDNNNIKELETLQKQVNYSKLMIDGNN